MATHARLFVRLMPRWWLASGQLAGQLNGAVMDATTVNAYRAISEAQEVIRSAKTLDEALLMGLRAIIKDCHAQAGAIWYADPNDNGRLHPYFWIGTTDLTSCVHEQGESVVGRVCQTQRAERYLSFVPDDDPATVLDFHDEPVTTMVCAPFSGGDAVIGCIQLVNKQDGSFLTDKEADICEIMAMVAGTTLEGTERLQPPWRHGSTIMRMRGVTRDFANGRQTTAVLKGIHLDVFEGEFLVLVGESGCGKTTLLNILGGMDRPTSGSFTAFGEDLTRATQRQLSLYRRHNTGFVFQDYHLMPNLNARQNLELIASLVADPMPADEALEAVGLGAQGHVYPSQLSGGQQQRVSIARALMKRPRVILADEPTAALDYHTAIGVLGVMERVAAGGTTLIMVTHNDAICHMADRVVRIRDGRVYEVTINRHKIHAADLVW